MTPDPTLRARLQQLVPTLTDRDFDDPGRPLRDLLSNAEYQATVLAVQQLVPEIDRSALEAGATWRDVASWIAAADPHESSEPHPRGSYRTRNASLRPLMPSDVEGLYLASIEPRSNHRWRFRGRTPSFGEFQAQLFADHVLSQYMVISTPSSAPVGLVAAYGADLVARHCHVAFQRTLNAPEEARGLMTEGSFAFLQYLFDHFAFRKVYLELPEYNLSLFSGGVGSLLVEEGRLKEHYFYGERYWDQCTYAIYHDAWEAVAHHYRGDWPAGHFDRQPGLVG